MVDNLRRVKKSSSSTLCPLLENIKLLNFYRKFHCFRLDLRERLFRKESSSCGRIGLACPGKIIIEIRKNTLVNTFIEMFFIHIRIELRKQQDNEVLSVDGRFVLPRSRGEREKKRNFHHR